MPTASWSNYHLRMPNQKKESVQRFKELNFKVIAAGDSYNDTAMLAEAHAGILFHPPQNVIDEFPQFPVTMNYAELRAEIDKASREHLMHRDRFYTLAASCPDRTGIIARVTGFIAEHQGWILESSFHADEATTTAAISCASRSRPIRCPSCSPSSASASGRSPPNWRWTGRSATSAVKKRVVVLVVKQEHCLYDLLARWQSKELDIEIPCVISNHDTFKGFVEWHGIPFHHVPVTADNKPQAYAEVQRLFEEVARRHHGAGALHADPLARTVRRAIRAGSSTSTTASCPASSAPSPTTRPISAASS